jgi:hypothetical protein
MSTVRTPLWHISGRRYSTIVWRLTRSLSCSIFNVLSVSNERYERYFRDTQHLSLAPCIIEDIGQISFSLNLVLFVIKQPNFENKPIIASICLSDSPPRANFNFSQKIHIPHTYPNCKIGPPPLPRTIPIYFLILPRFSQRRTQPLKTPLNQTLNTLNILGSQMKLDFIFFDCVSQLREN